MKVIKKGRAQRGWSREFACTGNGNGGGGCGAMLLVEQPDLFRTSRSSMGETDDFVTFECSECEVLTDIATCPIRPHDLPSRADWVKAQATARSGFEALSPNGD